MFLSSGYHYQEFKNIFMNISAKANIFLEYFRILLKGRGTIDSCHKGDFIKSHATVSLSWLGIQSVSQPQNSNFINTLSTFWNLLSWLFFDDSFCCRWVREKSERKEALGNLKERIRQGEGHLHNMKLLKG